MNLLPKVYIIHENEEWLTPLRLSLEKINVNYEEWLLDTKLINIEKKPPEGIFFSRMSASNYTRNHFHSNQSTKIILHWLESYNRRVINGSNVLNIELSKSLQQIELNKFGFKTPKTIISVGKEKIINAAKELNIWPMLLKPNQGGKGLGINLLNSIKDLESLLKQDLIESTLDNVWLLQEKIETNDDFITRMEFVDSSFLYSLNVFSQGSFELCPADTCEVNFDEFCPVNEQYNSDTKNEIKFIIEKKPDLELAKRIGLFLQKHQIEVAGVEFIKNVNNEPIIYDINTNTNYNLKAEDEAKTSKKGMDSIAQFLKNELIRIYK